MKRRFAQLVWSRLFVTRSAPQGLHRDQCDELASSGRALRDALPRADEAETKAIMARVRTDIRRGAPVQRMASAPRELPTQAWASAWAAAAVMALLAWGLGPGAGVSKSPSAELAIGAEVRRAHEWVEGVSPRALAPLGKEYESLEREITRAANILMASVP